MGLASTSPQHNLGSMRNVDSGCHDSVITTTLALVEERGVRVVQSKLVSLRTDRGVCRIWLSKRTLEIEKCGSRGSVERSNFEFSKHFV